MKNFLLVIFSSIVTIAAIYWMFLTGVNSARKFSIDGSSCLSVLPLIAELELKKSSDKYQGDLRCAHQLNVLAESLNPQKENSNTFEIYFHRLSETDSTMEDPDAFGALLERLRDAAPKYVTVYIHGWRHDDTVGDGDVQKFRTFLGYTRKFLNQRPELAGHQEIGIYLSWRGAAVRESGIIDGRTIAALASFWDRKAQSEKHAPSAKLALLRISDALNIKGDPNSKNKMLVVGHSMGGNMLATELTDAFNDQIDKKEYITAPYGNLVVLLNPAAEAEKWINIQVREQEVNKLYHLDQRPVYMSITSTDNWSADETGNGKVEYDSATGMIFPIAQIAAFTNFDSLKYTAIGHFFKNPATPYGASHEIINNLGANIETGFRALLSSENNSRCDEATGWLYSVRKRQQNSGRNISGWDSAYIGGKLDTLTYVRNNQRKIGDSSKNIAYQIRHGLSPAGKGSGSVNSPADPSTPFWNVRAFQNVIDDHGTVVNYPFWCAVNQMVMDDIVKQQ